MNIRGSFDFTEGYIVHWDKPKTNGGDPAGRHKDNNTGIRHRRRPDQLIAIRNAMKDTAHFIVGMIPIGPSSTTAAAI